MAEIKSTLELAMEKTKKISISKEEREEIKRKETLQKINGLFHRYMEGHLPLNEILKEIERMDEKTRPMAKEILLLRWIDALALNDQDERLFKGIESLKQQSIDEIRQKFHHLLSEYEKEKERIRETERAQIEELLKKEGIYGSAVEPKFEGSQHFEKELGNLNQHYGIKLKEIKEDLQTL